MKDARLFVNDTIEQALVDVGRADLVHSLTAAIKARDAEWQAKVESAELIARNVQEHFDSLCERTQEQNDTARREGWEEGILWMRDKTMVALNNDVAIDLDVIANELIEMGPVK